MHNTDKRKGNEAERILTPPDGGWGWMVVFSAFMICIISDGIIYAFGIFYEEFLRDFKDSRSLTSWVLSTMVGTNFFIAPVASKLTKKYGCRATTIAGSLCAASGLVASTVVPNVTWLIFTAGFCTGAGFGLMYLSTVVCVSFYFEKKLSFATGIAMSGSGIGVVLFAPFIQWMLDIMDWRSAMLIVAGLVLNCSVFGAFLRPLLPEKQTAPGINLATSDKKCHSPQNDDFPVKSMLYGSTHAADIIVPSPQSFAVLEMPSKLPARSDLQGDLLDLFANGTNTSAYTSVKRSSAIRKLHIRQKPLCNPECPRNLCCHSVDGPLDSVTHERKMDVTNKQTSFSFLCSRVNRRRVGSLVRMFGLGHFKDVAFLIVCVSTFCTNTGYDVPYVYFKDRLIELHIANDDDASCLLALLGISFALGGLISGYLSDRTWVNRLWMYNANIILCGLATALSCYFSNYSLMASYTAIFGYTTGAYMGLKSVVLIDIVGLDDITSALGHMLVFEGTACLIGPPITGWMFDYSGSYNPGYFFSGAMIALSGLMLFFIPCAQRLKSSRDQKAARTNSSLNQSTDINIAGT